MLYAKLALKITRYTFYLRKVRCRERRYNIAVSHPDIITTDTVLCIHTPHQVSIMFAEIHQSRRRCRGRLPQSKTTIASGIILSLKLGKKHRKTMSFTFNSDVASSPLFYI
jgi:hypothetical protein